VVVYNAIVVGLGGMGSAAAYHLSARGLRVLGLDRFGPARDRGASHGGSRIVRQSTSRARTTYRCYCAPTSCGGAIDHNAELDTQRAIGPGSDGALLRRRPLRTGRARVRGVLIVVLELPAEATVVRLVDAALAPADHDHVGVDVRGGHRVVP
jgi:hypothetical protein